MSEADRCHCPDCAGLDRRHPRDGHQLKLIDQTPEQRAPTPDEAAAALFALAGVACIPRRQARFDW